MTSLFTKSRVLATAIAVVCGVACLFTQAMSAHAATPDQLAAMQTQLMHASAQLQMMVAPQPSVLGASTTDTTTLLAALKAQLASIDLQIASLQTTRAQVLDQIAKLQSASTTAISQLIVKTSVMNPLTSTIQVKSSTTSDWSTVFAFDLDTNNSTSLISVNTIQIGVVVGHSKGGFDALVAGAALMIDGKTFTKYTVSNVRTSDGVATLVFDVEGNELIKAGSRAQASLKLRFKALTAANEGATVQGRVLAGNVQARGSQLFPTTGYLFKSTGSVTGNVMTLRTKGMLVEAGATTAVLNAAQVSGQHDYVTYTMKLDAVAFGQDVYIAKNTLKSVAYTMVNSSGVAVGASSTAISLTSTADTDSSGQYYVVHEGSMDTFSLVVNWMPGKASAAEALQLKGLNYAGTAVPATTKWIAEPAKDFRTDFVIVTN